MNQNNLFNQSNFLLATRDSGYKNLSFSIAELVDNSFDAQATRVDVHFKKDDSDYRVIVSDNGLGMNSKTLEIALQFGGSTRFNSRLATGRYGMGLPNSSLSQAKRVEVFTWQKPNSIYYSYLDIDEIIQNKIFQVPRPKRSNKKKLDFGIQINSGTIVKWSKCDRLKYKRENFLINELHLELGKIFRKKIYSGKTIFINNQQVMPFDPLYIKTGRNIKGGIQHGNILTYHVRPPDTDCINKLSIVKVTFSLLPIEEWYLLSNEDKNKHGISKSAGVSIIRAGREIDYGWFFMGSKRKENYDDWWRCEVEFEPILDELFGVTHTKQEIHPTDIINNILTPDIEKIGRELNRQVRETFIRIKQKNSKAQSEKVVERLDHLLEPVHKKRFFSLDLPTRTYKRKAITGMQYKIMYSDLKSTSLIMPELNKNCIFVTVNKSHLFYKRFLSKLENDSLEKTTILRTIVEILFFALARAELSLTTRSNNQLLDKIRKTWSINLNNFLQ